MSAWEYDPCAASLTPQNNPGIAIIAVQVRGAVRSKRLPATVLLTEPCDGTPASTYPVLSQNWNLGLHRATLPVRVERVIGSLRRFEASDPSRHPQPPNDVCPRCMCLNAGDKRTPKQAGILNPGLFCSNSTRVIDHHA